MSKSYENSEVVELNETIFHEASADSLPFHGFPSPNNSAPGVQEGPIKTGQVAPLKRAHSSPGTENKILLSRHPTIGSKILVDTIDGKGVYEVRSKKNNSVSDFVYCLAKDGKESTLNLKRVKWSIYDALERVPLNMKGRV